MVLIVLVIVFTGAVGYFALIKKSVVPIISTYSDQQTAPTQNSQQGSRISLQQYKNEKYKIEFAYPSNYCIQEGSSYAQYFIRFLSNTPSCPSPKYENGQLVSDGSALVEMIIFNKKQTVDEYIASKMPSPHEPQYSSYKFAVKNFTTETGISVREIKVIQPYAKNFWVVRNESTNYFYILENDSLLATKILSTLVFTH